MKSGSMMRCTWRCAAVRGARATSRLQQLVRGGARGDQCHGWSLLGGCTKTQVRLSTNYSGPDPRDKQPAPLPDEICRGERPDCHPRDVLRSSQNDIYRLKVPDVEVEPLPPSKAKPMVMCPCHRGLPCAPRGKLCVPPVPPPPPRPPFPWHYYYPFALILGFFGLMYQLYMWKKESDKRKENDSWKPRRFVRRPQYFEQMPKKVPYLIIGTGQAGMAAYNAIKQFDPCAKVLLITAEDVLPYQRSALSKGMWFNPKPPDINTLLWMDGDKKVSMLYLKPAEYTEVADFARRTNGPMVAVAMGWRVSRIDPDECIAYIKDKSGDKPIVYEKCLIATGSKPRTTDVFRFASLQVRDKVCRLRALRDMELARKKLETAKRCVIIGSGPLACELSWTLGHLYNKTDRGEDAVPVEIVHVMRDKGILGRLVPDYLAEWAAEKLKDEGVVLVPKAEVHDAYINPKTDRLSLYLSNGKEMETDHVFLCVGSDPDVDLAAPSFLEVDSKHGGFLVNTEMQARTNLYVAGDAASLYQQWRGERQRNEHLMDASASGCVAGENMTGRWKAFNQPSHYQVRLGDSVFMEAVGEVNACMTTVGVFAKCKVEERASTTTAAQAQVTRGAASVGSAAGDAAPADEKPCYKKTAEYRKRYEKGIIYYMQDRRIAGVVFWNIDDQLVEDRKDVVVEILRAEPTYDDIELITDLLRFHDDKC